MLVYTTLFTLAPKEPKDNKYIDMFYIWFSYLKRYAGLGPDDCVGVIVDEDTLEYMNSNQTFGYISTGVPFTIELSIMPRPANLTEGFAQRYNLEHFDTFTHHELNLHIDIDCLCIRNIQALFNQVEGYAFYAMSEIGFMYHSDYCGHLLKEGILPEDFPGISAGWYAWKHSESQREMFESVSKGCLYNETPFYTVDQPFYTYELIQRMLSKTLDICLLDKRTVAFNACMFDECLKDAYFVNFAGEPGVESSHYNKLFAFICMDFSTSPVYSSATVPIKTLMLAGSAPAPALAAAPAPALAAAEQEGLLPALAAAAEQEEQTEHGHPEGASPAPLEEVNSRSSPPSP